MVTNKVLDMMGVPSLPARAFQKDVLTGQIMPQGGGDSPDVPEQPDKITHTNINIPPYARPYVESLLGRSEALTTGSQFEPYNPSDRFAGLDPLQQQAYDSAAGMTTAPEIDQAGSLVGHAMQQSQLGSEHADMLMNTALGYGQQGQQWGQLGAGFGQQAADFGAMGMGLGQQGMGLGQQGIGIGQHGMGFGDAAYGIGQQYQQGMTDPSAVQAYMSPYMQNVVDVQKQEAIRDYQTNLPSLHSQATSTGGFGGSRHAILEAEAQRNLAENLSNIQSTGQQQAYTDAMRNMQSGAQMGMQGAGMGMQGAGVGLQGMDMGMQGLQTGFQGIDSSMQGAGMGMQGAGMGMQGVETGLQGVGQGIGAAQLGQQNVGNILQGAGTLGNLGQQRFGQQAGIMDAQQALGGMQQQHGQQYRDFDYQQFMDELNFPYQQLAFMADMTQGLPLSQSTMYQNTPQQQFGLPQLMGLGMQGYGLANRAQGGRVNKPVRKYADGGMIEPVPAEPMAFDGMAPDEIASSIALLSDEQLAQYAQIVQDETTLGIIQGEMRRRQRLRGQAEFDPSSVDPGAGAEGVMPAQGLGAVPQIGLRAQNQVAQQVPPPNMTYMAGGGFVERIKNLNNVHYGSPTTEDEHKPEDEHKRNKGIASFSKEEQTAQDRRDLLRAPAAAADVFIGGPVNATSRGLEWIANSRAGRIFGGGDVELPRIGSGTGTPYFDMLHHGDQAPEDNLEDSYGFPDASSQPFLPPDFDYDDSLYDRPELTPEQALSGEAPQAVEQSARLAITSSIPQSVDSPSSPQSYEEYKAQLDADSDNSLQEQMLLDAMRQGLDDRQAQLEVRERRDKMDALIVAGAAMMRGRNLTEGLTFAGEAGALALREATAARDALEDGINQAELAQQQYELGLMREDSDRAQKSYHAWMQYDQKNTELGMNYKLALAKIGATLQAAQIRSAGSGREFDLDLEKALTILNSTSEAKEYAKAADPQNRMMPGGEEIFEAAQAKLRAKQQELLGYAGHGDNLGIRTTGKEPTQ